MKSVWGIWLDLDVMGPQILFADEAEAKRALALVRRKYPYADIIHHGAHEPGEFHLHDGDGDDD